MTINILIIQVIILITLFNNIYSQNNTKEVRKNNMKVKWEIQENMIHFQLEAPTRGWVAIGFNQSASLSGTYLIMGRVTTYATEVVEHYIEKPGSYYPLHDYEVPSSITSISGVEQRNKTKIKFSIPLKKISKYHKHLAPNSLWTMLMAYSQDDDFRHHSSMRTSVKIKL